MIYVVAPRECGDELYEQLRAYYSDDPNVTVIVDRRERDRRGRAARGEAQAESQPAAQRREVRDRRRARVVGELSSVATVAG